MSIYQLGIIYISIIHSSVIYYLSKPIQLSFTDLPYIYILHTNPFICQSIYPLIYNLVIIHSSKSITYSYLIYLSFIYHLDQIHL